MWSATRDRRLFVGLTLALVALAWLSLWAWGESPYGRFLRHDELAEVVRDGPGLLLVFVAGYLGSWTLFGALVHLGDLAVHEAAERSAWLGGMRG